MPPDFVPPDPAALAVPVSVALADTWPGRPGAPRPGTARRRDPSGAGPGDR